MNTELSLDYQEIKNQHEKRNFAKIEILVVEPIIEDLLIKEFSCSAIYSFLVSEGRVKMKYSTFRNYMRKRKKAAEAEQVTSVVPVVSALPPPSPSPPLPESQEATHTTSSNSASNNAPTPPTPQAETPTRKPLAKAGLFGLKKQEIVHNNVPDDNLTSYPTNKATT